jgi:hypothetical protein
MLFSGSKIVDLGFALNTTFMVIYQQHPTKQINDFCFLPFIYLRPIT